MDPLIIENTTFDTVQQSGINSYALAFSQNTAPIIIRKCVINGCTAQWGLKFSKCFNLTIEDCEIKNGTERCLDMVRGGNAIFRRCIFLNEGTRKVVKTKWDLDMQCDIGLKGGIRDATFEDCVMNDLLLGDYSIYDQINRPKTRRITLTRCKSPNNKSIIIRSRYAEGIITNETEVSQLIWPSPITKVYWWYNRKYGDRRIISPDQFVISPEELN